MVPVVSNTGAVVTRHSASVASSESSDLWLELHGHRSRLVALAVRSGLAIHDAQDAASEAILRAATHRNLKRDLLPQFLATVLRRICVDEFRRLDRERRSTCDMWYPPTSNPTETIPIKLDVLTMLAKAGLSKPERAVVVMRAYGHPHTEIARYLNTTVRTTEVTLSRARAKARQWAGVG